VSFPQPGQFGPHVIFLGGQVIRARATLRPQLAERVAEFEHGGPIAVEQRPQLVPFLETRAAFP
jgi:hypothetical protein